MLRCENCKVDIEGDFTNCPLCDGNLTGNQPTKDVFPYIPTIYKEFSLLLRILMFVSIVVAVVFTVVNMIFFKENQWSLVLISAIISMWLGLYLIIKKKNNIPKAIIWLVALIAALALVWDYYMGWIGWSINYVLPSVFGIAMIIMAIAAKILRISVRDYMVYLLIDALFALVPLLFLWTGILNVSFPSILCVGISVISISALILFEGQNIKEELNKRMHL